MFYLSSAICHLPLAMCLTSFGIRHPPSFLSMPLYRDKLSRAR